MKRIVFSALIMLLFASGLIAQVQHFDPVAPNGDNWPIIISGATINEANIEPGDEIGVFDLQGEGDEAELVCVGAIVFEEFPSTVNVCRRNVAFELPGFIADNPVLFYLWDSSEGIEYEAEMEVLEGNGTFGFGAYALVNLYVGEVNFPPDIATNVENLDFDEVLINEPASLDIIVSNLGNQDLVITSAEITGDAEFTIPDFADVTITEGNQETITVTFAPEMAGDFEATLTIYNNDPDESEYEIEIIGTGIEEVENHFIPVNNTGSPWNAIFRGAVIDGEDVAAGDEIAVFDGDLCVGADVYEGIWALSVVCWEGDPGNGLPGFTRGNEMSYKIWDADMDQEYIAYPIYEEGQGFFYDGPYASLTLTTEEPPQPGDIEVTDLLDMGQTVDTDLSSVIQIFNVGDDALTINNVYLEGDDAFSMSEFDEVTLAVDEDLGIEITFTPALVGEYQTTMVIQSNDPDEPEVLVTVNAEVVEELEAHFDPVDRTGTPWNVIVRSAAIDDEAIVTGDEIGVFDGDLCVGAVVFEGEWAVSVVCWQRDVGNGLIGFTEYNPISYRLWDASEDEESTLYPIYETGGGEFMDGPFARCDLNTIKPPTLELEEELAFNQVLIGSTPTNAINLFNSGFLPLTITSAILTGDDAFSMDNFNEIIIDQDQGSAINITFAPQEEIEYNAILTIECTDPNNPVRVIDITGSGIAEFEAHFQAVDNTGFPWNVIVADALIDGNSIVAGDEIAIFDGDLCVGVRVFDGNFRTSVVCWRNYLDEGLPGYVIGNPITCKLWDASEQEERVAYLVDITNGDGTFEVGPYCGCTITTEEPPTFPEIEVDTEVDLGFINIMTNYVYDLNIENLGDGVLSIISAEITGDDAFSLDNFQGVDIPAGEDYDLEIIFSPVELREYDATLTLTTNDEDEATIDIALHSEGIEGGAHFVGVPDNGLPSILIVENAYIAGEPIEDGDEIGVFDGELCISVGRLDEEFPIEVRLWRGSIDMGIPGYTPENPMIFRLWDASENQEIDVVYHVIENGMGDGTFDGAPFTVVSVSDAPFEPEILVNPDTYNFGPVQVDHPVTFNIAISNTGNLDLNITSAVIEGDNVFSIETFENVAVEHNEIVNIPVTFNPVAVEDYTANLVINSDDPINPVYSVPLQGNGVAGHFTPVQDTGDPWAVIVQEALLEGNNLEVDDEIAIFDGELCVGAYVITGDWPVHITVWRGNAGQELPGFTDGNPMLYKYWDSSSETEVEAYGVLNVEGNGFFFIGAFLETSLSDVRPGREIGLDAEVVAEGLDFGDVLVDMESTLNVTISNIGTDNLLIDSVEVSGDGFSAPDMYDVVIAADANVVLPITFTPTEAAEFNGTVTIDCNDIDSPRNVITVVGTGYTIESHFEDRLVEPTGREWNVLIQNAYLDINLLQIGDEVAIFDDQLCVGTSIVTNEWGADDPLTIVCYGAVPENELEGFTDGNPLNYRVYHPGSGEFLAYGENYVEGDGTFNNGPYAEIVEISASTLVTDITGTVYDAFDEEHETVIANAEVRISVLSTHTDDNGYYELYSLPQGTFEAHISAEGFVTLDTTLTLDEEEMDQDFSLVPVTGMISGYVLECNDEGAPIEGVLVFLNDSEVRDATTDEFGYYEINNILPSEGNVLRFEHTFHWPTEVENITVEGYEETEVDVYMDNVSALVNPERMDMTVYIGGGTDSTGTSVFNIENNGCGLFDWDITIPNPEWTWLSVDPVDDELESGEAVNVTITADIRGTGDLFDHEDSLSVQVNLDAEYWDSPTFIVVTITFVNGVPDANGELPTVYALHQNYPNPFNPNTSIQFDLVDPQRVSLSVYNVVGQEIAQILNSSPLGAGVHIVNFNAPYLPTGVYFYSIKTEKFHDIKKMMLIK